jgi:hypothetical protein
MGYGCGLGTCTSCDTENTRVNGRGWCVACYHRWYRAGADPNAAPPDPAGPKAISAQHREEVFWLVQGGESVEQAAARIGVTVKTAERYVNPPPPRPVCAVRDCEEQSTYHRWCDGHRDLRPAYEQARASGMSRQAAAFHLGVEYRKTYLWEPGQPGRGRPRKRVAA